MVASSETVAELAAGVRQQAHQAAGALAGGDVFEAGTLLLDALIRIAEALERLEARLQELGV